MSSSWGNYLKISIFGESHGPRIGVVIDGLPAGLAIDRGALSAFMLRRAWLFRCPAHCTRRISPAWHSQCVPEAL